MMVEQRSRPSVSRPRVGLGRLLAAVLPRRRAEDLAYEQLVRLWSPLPPSGAAPMRRTLLAPEAGPTAFEGREAERDGLLRWCTDPASAPVLVLAGVGGVGKSRLAVELARALPRGWTAGVARPGTAAQIVPVAAAVGGRRSVLVVVDDADTEPAVDIAMLVAHAADAPDRVRVLVVMRDAAAFGVLLDDHAPGGAWHSQTLSVIDGDRSRFFGHAVRALSGLAEDASLPPWAEPGRGPVGAGGEPPGITHARAALAVLADDPEHALAMRTADVDELTDAIRTRERQRWAATAADPRWGLDDLEPEAQEEALLALLLCRPRHVEDAIATLRAVSRFQGGDEDHVRDIANWARHLYPGHVGGRWLDPRPDLLRGALLTVATDRHRPHLIAALERDPSGFLRVARVADGNPRVATLLRGLLTDVRLDAVIEAAVLAGAFGLCLRDYLVEALDGCSPSSLDVERLLPITEAPMWSPVRVALRRAEVRHRRAAPDGPMRLGAALTRHAATLRDLGAHQDALAPTREAVALYRDVAAEHELAAALTGLGASLRELGVHDDALAATREAVQQFRGLTAADPDRHGPELAHALIDLGTDLRHADEHDEALAVGEEAVRRYRDLAAAAPARHVPDLAAALTGLGASQRELGAHDDALAASREAVRLYRDVVANHADLHGADLARALADVGADLRDARAFDDAVTASREAVQRYQELAAADPTRHLPGLARSLTVLGSCLRDVGAYMAGLAATGEAVQLSRELAAADPRHGPDLSRALRHLGVSLRGLGPADDSLAPGHEAVRLSRDLAAADPRHDPDLARALTQLGISLRGTGAHEEALTVACEAVERGRELAAAHPARHIPELTRALVSLGASLRALGRRAEAVAHEGEAVGWWWHLTEQRPGAFDERYREAQRRYFHTFSAYEHDPDGLRTAELIARSRVLAYLDGLRVGE